MFGMHLHGIKVKRINSGVLWSLGYYNDLGLYNGLVRYALEVGLSECVVG